MKRALILCAVLCGVSCKRDGEIRELGLRITSPAGMSLDHVSPGPPVQAVFKQGFSLTVADVSDIPDLTKAGLPESLGLLEKLRAANAAPTGEPTNIRRGTLPTGPVVRYELQEGDSRTLLYAGTFDKGVLVMALTAPKAEFEMLANRVEQALGTIRR